MFQKILGETLSMSTATPLRQVEYTQWSIHQSNKYTLNKISKRLIVAYIFVYLMITWSPMIHKYCGQCDICKSEARNPRRSQQMCILTKCSLFLQTGPHEPYLLSCLFAAGTIFFSVAIFFWLSDAGFFIAAFLEPSQYVNPARFCYALFINKLCRQFWFYCATSKTSTGF